ncbi:MAG: hypothetical protein ACRDF5_05640 [bacterium]
MKPPYALVIARTVRGHFKLYLEGQAFEGVPGPRRLLLRYVPILAQPRRGFRTLEEAHDLFLDLLREGRRRDYERETAIARHKSGSPLPEHRVLRSGALLRRLRRQVAGGRSSATNR